MDRAKQWAITLCLLLTVPLLNAQIPTIATANFFQLNTSYPYKIMIDTSLRTAWEGSAGANATWNFNSLDFQNRIYAIDTTVFVSPSGTPKFSSCGISGTDTADICLVNKSGQFFRTDDYRYYKQTGHKIIELGSDQDNGVVEEVNYRFSRPAIHSLMPFTYLSTAFDSFYNTYDSHLSGRHFVKGKDSIVADGYGTLMIDGKTIANCVRTVKIHKSVDSNGLLGLRKRYYATYTWYSKHVEGPILILEKSLDSTSSVTPPVIYEAHYYFKDIPTTVGRVKDELAVTISPNPAHNQVDVKLLKEYKGCVFQMYDMTGRLLINENLSAGNNVINMSNLPAGLYIYQIQNAQGNNISGKISKA